MWNRSQLPELLSTFTLSPNPLRISPDLIVGKHLRFLRLDFGDPCVPFFHELKESGGVPLLGHVIS
jgi:hypothetical protein